MTDYLPLDEGHFSYVAVSGNRVEIKVGNQLVDLSLDTCEHLVPWLASHIQDREMRRRDYIEMIERGATV